MTRGNWLTDPVTRRQGIGMLLAGAFAVSASEWLPWPLVFLLLGGVFAAFTLLVLAAPEPDR